MKKILLTLILALAYSFGFAQNWETNFDTAKKLAKESNKKIIMVFSGSDWCAPCIKLDKQIWSNDAFITHANKNYIMLKADFPKRKKNALTKEQQEHNNKLAEQYNTSGYFPFVVVTDKDANVLGTTGYKKVSVAEYINTLDSF